MRRRPCRGEASPFCRIGVACKRFLQQIANRANGRRRALGVLRASRESTIGRAPSELHSLFGGRDARLRQRISCIVDLAEPAMAPAVDRACGDSGGACRRKPLACPVARPLPKPRRLSAGCRLRRARRQRLTQHDQRRLEIGHTGRRCNRSGCQRGLQEQPGGLKRMLDVAAGQILVEAGALRQHLHDGLLQPRRQACRGRQRRRDWRTAAPGFLLRRRGLRRRR